MKKFIAIMLACFAAFTLASCSEKVPAATPTPVSTSTPVPSVDEDTLEKVSKVDILETIEYILVGSAEFTGFENLSAEHKDLIPTFLLDAGLEITFDGNCMIEKDIETGEITTYCVGWLNPPMDEDLTPPAFGTMRMVTSKETEFIAQYADVTMDDAKADAITLREAGYTVNSLEFDLVSIGEDTYSFTGSSEDGVSVECLYTEGYMRLALTAAQ